MPTKYFLAIGLMYALMFVMSSTYPLGWPQVKEPLPLIHLSQSTELSSLRTHPTSCSQRDLHMELK